MRHTNCIVFAVRLWWRRGRAHRGYIVLRRSDWGPFPHVLYAEIRRGRVRLVSYKPASPEKRKMPPPCFEGRVRWGDVP